MKSFKKAFAACLLTLLSAFILSCTALAAVIPAKPADLKAESVTRNSVTLSWSKSRYADFYRVYILENGEWTELTDLTETSYKISGLRPACTYTFAVKSVNESGNRDYFSKEYATLKVKTKTLSKVRATAVSGVDYVKLSWNKTSYATGYNVYQRVNGKWKLLKKLGKDKRSYTVKGLESDTAYQFSVRARGSADGESIYSPHYTVKISTMKPNKVKLSIVSATDSSVKLKWTRAEDATGYRVYRYSGGKWVTVKTLNYPDKLSCTVSSLKSDSRHKFRVRAFCEYSDRTVWFTASASKTAVTEPGKDALTVYRTDKLRDFFDEGFTLSYKTENSDFGKMKVTVSKRGVNYYLSAEMGYVNYELLNLEAGSYVLLRDKKAYAEVPGALEPTFSIEAAVEDLLPSAKMKSKATLVEFEGEGVVCETYYNTARTKVFKYYYRTGELRGIEQYSAGKLVERAVITKLSQSSLKGVFSIPADYTRLSY